VVQENLLRWWRKIFYGGGEYATAAEKDIFCGGEEFCTVVKDIILVVENILRRRRRI